MKDVITGKRIEVHTDGDAGPYIIVPDSQADDVRRLLREHDILFDERSNSVRGDSGNDTIFDLGIGANVQEIQSVLDATDN